MQKVSEKAISNKIINWLNAQPNCQAHKRLANINNSGQADITGTQKLPVEVIMRNAGVKLEDLTIQQRAWIELCSVGIRIEIEVKRPGQEPRPNQLKQIEKNKTMNAISFWCDSLTQCQDMYLCELAFLIGRWGNLIRLIPKQ